MSLLDSDATQLDTFIDHLWLEDGLSKNTLESYRLDLASFALWLTPQNKQLLTVDQADIQQYLAVKFPHSKPRSISRLIASLRRFYRYLMRDNKISLDPTIQIQSPKLPRSLPKSLNEDEVVALLNAPNINEPAGLRDRAMLEPVSYTHLKHKDAFNAYDKFLKDYPNSPLVADAKYGLGYTQFALRNYKSAIATQQKLIDLHPETVSYTHLDVYKRQQ